MSWSFRTNLLGKPFGTSINHPKRSRVVDFTSFSPLQERAQGNNGKKWVNVQKILSSLNNIKHPCEWHEMKNDTPAFRLLILPSVLLTTLSGFYVYDIQKT